jgi:hypothetical protein
MSDLRNLERAKQQADEAAYRRGYKEGVDVTMWAGVFIALTIFFLLYWF